jgi:hypothetical protein
MAPNFPSTFANIATVTLDDQVDGPATNLSKSNDYSKRDQFVRIR